MGKDWSANWSERDRLLQEELARFKSGLPAVGGLTDAELRDEEMRLEDLYGACRSKEAVSKGQPITAEVLHRMKSVGDELAARAAAVDTIRSAKSLAIDEESLEVSKRSLEVSERSDQRSKLANLMSFVALVVALASFVMQCRGK